MPDPTKGLSRPGVTGLQRNTPTIDLNLVSGRPDGPGQEAAALRRLGAPLPVPLGAGIGRGTPPPGAETSSIAALPPQPSLEDMLAPIFNITGNRGTPGFQGIPGFGPIVNNPVNAPSPLLSPQALDLFSQSLDAQLLQGLLPFLGAGPLSGLLSGFGIDLPQSPTLRSSDLNRLGRNF